MPKRNSAVIDGVDEFDFDAPEVGSPSKKQKKSAADYGGTGKSRKPNTSPPSQGICPVPPCPHIVKAKKRFCEFHVPTWENMYYQAKSTKLKNEDGTIQKDDKGKDKTKLESFNAAMRDDRVAGMAVEVHLKNNPPAKKYRRWSFIDWASWDREFGQRAEVGEEDRNTPMTKRIFERWAENVMGEDAASIEEWWQELFEDANIDRDYKGRRGELQLYVPKQAERFRRKFKFEGSTAKEGSKVAKDATEEDIQEYRDQVGRQGNSFSSDWLRVKPAGEASAGSTDQLPEQKEEADGDKAATLASPAKTIKMRKGEITAVRAAVFEDVNNKLEKLKTKMLENINHVPDAWNLYKEERAKGGVSVSLLAFADVALKKVRTASLWVPIALPDAIDSVTAGGATKIEDEEVQAEVPQNMTDGLQFCW